MVNDTIRVNVYEIVARAVEDGINMGWHVAHKYSDTPNEEEVKSSIQREVMLELSEILYLYGEP